MTAATREDGPDPVQRRVPTAPPPRRAPIYDRQIPPYRLSPAAWKSGFRDHQLAVELHEMGCDEPGYDERRAEVEVLHERLS